MTDFHGAAITLTQDQAQKIALKGGKFHHLAGGYNTDGETEITVPSGWGYTRINTKGVGNRGDYVLTARSKMAKEYLREGKIRMLTDQGFTSVEATAIVHGLKIKYVFEEKVLEVAVNTCHEDAWLSYPAPGKSVRAWMARNDIGGGLSVPRMETVRAIVMLVRKVNDIEESGS